MYMSRSGFVIDTATEEEGKPGKKLALDETRSASKSIAEAIVKSLGAGREQIFSKPGQTRNAPAPD
jgi:hypothetical protein